MAVRWIIGRAGTGKTARCVREMRDEMRRDALGDGALLLITPEQATFSAERLLLTATGPGVGAVTRGTFRAQVLSFRRLAMLVGREVGVFGGGGGRAVPKPRDDVARVVMLEETVRRHRGELRVFAAVADRPGFIRALDATLTELRRQGHSGASLRTVIEEGTAGGARMDPVAALKLHDLAVILDAWSAEVDNPAAWDFEYLMQQAAKKAGESALIAGAAGPACIWVDAFSAMTAIELRLLAALGKHARALTITLLADPDAPSFVEMRGSVTPAGATYGVFARTERLHRRITDALLRNGVAVESTEALRTVHRFNSPALRKVEAELFSQRETVRRADTAPAREMPAEPRSIPGAKKRRGDGRHVAAQQGLFDFGKLGVDGPTGPAPLSGGKAGGSPVGVEIWESSDPETEVRAAAQAIRAMAIGPDATLRYRQIGIIVPDLEGYHDCVRRVFAEHAIPHFIDQRRGIAHHPLVELVRSAVAIAANRWERDDLLLYLKSRLAGVTDADVSLIENYVIEHGITRVRWSDTWKWMAPNQTLGDLGDRLPLAARARLARINGIRVKVNADLEPLVAALETASGEADAAGYARALQDLFKRLQIETQMQAWIDAAAGAKDAELGQVHQQAWREVAQLLKLLEKILDGKTRSLPEFERLLSTALENLTLGLIPPTVDQVLVSSVMRSRVPELEAVIILGAQEGQFPKVVGEDAILSDAERAAFNESAADPIGEGSDRQLLEMPFFDYVALTRARRFLVVSFSLADRQGKAIGRSRYVQRLRDLLEKDVKEWQFDVQSRTDIARIATGDDLLAGVAAWAREEVRRGTAREPRALNDAQAREAPAWTRLYHWLLHDTPPAWCDALNLVWEVVRGRGAPRLGMELAQRFYPPKKPLFMSISQLEKFAACPLQYFMHYTLRLKPRGDLKLDSMEMGTLYHSILERVYRRVLSEEISWPQCDARTLREPLEEEVDAAIAELHGELAQREPGYEKTRARLKRTLAIILEADRRRACKTDLRPTRVEQTFGRGGPPEEIASSSPVKTEAGAGTSGQPRVVKLSVLSVLTPRAHNVHVSGKIDRIDSDEGGAGEVVVIDYKSSSSRSLDLYRVLAGLSLQLPVYALVMREVDQSRPIAALYLSLGIRPSRVVHAGAAVDPDSDAFYQAFKPRGILDLQFAGRLDPEIDAESKHVASKWYKIKLNKGGEPAKTKANDALTHEDFELVLNYAQWKIGALADQLMAGQIAPSPWRKSQQSPCEVCEFCSLCPFDRVNGTYREVKGLGIAQTLAEMRAAMSTAAAPA